MTPTLIRASNTQQSAGPQLQPLKLLHRHDGYIAFALKEGDSFRPTIAIKATALESLFPGYVDMLAKNSYVSINAAYTLARGGDCHSLKGHPRHRQDTLKYLCACYCDIDLYKAQLTFTQAHARVMEMCEAGILPWASMVVNSGRGMWLLWLLHDSENPDQAHCGAWGKAEFDPLMVYSRINRAIIERLRHLGADPQCTDGARYIRVPGSFRTDNENTVWWSIQGSGQGGFSYTLWQLADLMNVRCRRMLPAEVEATKPRKKIPGRASGQIAANKSRLCVITTLMGLRGGGFRKGHRGKGAWIFAMCLCKRGVPFSEAIQVVREYGRDCTPVFRPAECDAQTRSGYKGGRWSYRKIAAELGVTVEEAEVISQRINKAFPCAEGALREIVHRNGKETRTEAIASRRMEIQRIVAETGNVLPYRTMEARLKQRGFEVGTFVTIGNDYKAMGLTSPRTAKIRKIAQAQESQGQLISAA